MNMIIHDDCGKQLIFFAMPELDGIKDRILLGGR